MSKLLAVVAALAVALAFSAPAFADKGSGGGAKPGQLKVEGTVSAVNATAGTVSITSGGMVVTVSVTATTKVERNGRHSTLAGFKVGDRGQALYTATGAASKVEATGP